MMWVAEAAAYLVLLENEELKTYALKTLNVYIIKTLNVYLKPLGTENSQTSTSGSQMYGSRQLFTKNLKHMH